MLEQKWVLFLVLYHMNRLVTGCCMTELSVISCVSWANQIGVVNLKVLILVVQFGSIDYGLKGTLVARLSCLFNNY